MLLLVVSLLLLLVLLLLVEILAFYGRGKVSNKLAKVELSFLPIEVVFYCMDLFLDLGIIRVFISGVEVILS